MFGLEVTLLDVNVHSDSVLSLTFLFLNPLLFLLLPPKATNDSIPNSLSHSVIPLSPLQASHISLGLDHTKLSLSFFCLQAGFRLKPPTRVLKFCLCGTLRNDELLQCQRSWLNASLLEQMQTHREQTVVAHQVEVTRLSKRPRSPENIVLIISEGAEREQTAMYSTNG